MKYDIEKIIQIVRSTAKKELLPLFANVERHYKSDGSVVTQADNAMQHSIKEQLKALYPNTLMLGEEMSVEEQMSVIQSDGELWCLDPLDGTNNFTAGIPYFSVSLALLTDNKVTMGIVYDPIRDELFSADEQQGVKLNGDPVLMRQSDLVLKKSIAIIDFKRLDNELAMRLINDAPYASQRSFGSVALDWCWLTMNRSHVYLHGRSNIWDYAAGHYIFTKAGGYSSTLTGEDIFTRNLTKRSAVAAVDKTLFTEWSSWINTPQR